MVVEDAQTGYVGAVVRIEYGRMELEDRHGRRKPFPIGPGYLIDGRPVILTTPRRAAPSSTRTASGSVAVQGERPRSRWPAGSTSRAATTPNSSSRCGETIFGSRASWSNTSAGSTIWSGSSRSSGPGPGRRLGVLVDHLVAGSKEARIADAVRRGPGGAHTLVVGHPFMDIWQAVKPSRLGIAAWPVVPRGEDWKHGVCRALGLAARPPGGHRQGVAADPGHGCGTGTTWSLH